jgi:glycosyltransferase involved in cell wall biosynthesis
LDSLYFTYWSLDDPLTQTQCVPVVEALAEMGYRMALTTYERERTWSAQTRQHAERLSTRGVQWYRLGYHERPKVVSTAWDAFFGLVLGLRVAVVARPRLFHSRATVPAAPAAGAAVLSGARFLYDADGPLSEEYVDAGVWRRGSFPHRLTAAAERGFARYSTAMLVLTEARRRQVETWTQAPVRVIPCAVDTQRFRPDRAMRQLMRLRLGVSNETTVLVYAGKYGGWYGVEEMMAFTAAVRRVLGAVRLLVLTRQSFAPFVAAAHQSAVADCLLCRRAAHHEMPTYLSAADVALSFVRPLPSKIAACPVKNGEYLACGLPLVTPENIGDYSALVRREALGVVLERLDESAFLAGAHRLRALLRQGGLARRCREAAKRHFDLHSVVLPRYQSVYRALLGPPRGVLSGI